MKGLSIQHRHSTPYYPQCNGLVEKVNGLLSKIISKQVKDNANTRDKHLYEALWAEIFSFRTSLGFIPFYLVHGQEALIPIAVGLLAPHVI